MLGRGDWPNLPDVARYAKHAQTLGFQVQWICEREGPGAYYSVVALYDEPDGSIFGREPAGILFEDFSKSVDITWVFRRYD